MTDTQNTEQGLVVPAGPEASSTALQQPATTTTKGVITPLVKISIIALIVAGIASVVLVLLNPVANVGSRATATFALFAFFVATTLLSAKMQRMPAWFTPLSFAVSSFVLVAGLVHTWAVGLVYTKSEYDYYGYAYRDYSFEIHGYIFLLFAGMGIAFWVATLILWFGGLTTEFAGGVWAFRSAIASAALLLVAAAMTVLVPHFEAFGFYPHDLYWRSIVAVLVLSAMFLAITAILVIVIRTSRDNAKVLAERRAAQRINRVAAGTPVPAAVVETAVDQTAAVPTTAAHAAQPSVAAPASQTVAPTAVAPANQSAPVSPAAPIVQPPEQVVAAGQGLLPWPTFADGRPLPALPNGQPDFSVPGAPYPPHLLRD
ncbi:hypothetical protein [Canibacter oris]|uniref:Uncharacterized protein n=1 Tax=Canibacter oris TaxID=1365628 RepID=A0A840DNV8_9MICO|nr:hypothetical protein [Canibacter oris]MBB4071767.1 hypothetical protein [Canibacter oris]